MSGPGGKEVGRLNLKVLPDTDGFAEKLQAFADRVEAQVEINIPLNIDTTAAKIELRAFEQEVEGTNINVDVEVDGSAALAHLDIVLAAMQGTADLNKVHVDVELDTAGAEVHAAASAISRNLTTAGAEGAQSMGRIGQQIALWGPLIFIAAAGIAGLAPALAVVFPLFFAVGASIGVILLSLKQIQKTFKPIVTGFKNMRAAVGNALTAGLGPLIQTFVTKFLPVIKAGLVAFATFMNGALKGLLGFLNGANGIGLISQLFAGLGPALQPFARLLPLVLSVFLRLAVVALPALEMMGNALVTVTAQFDNLLKSGSASGVVTTAMSQLGQVFVILGRLGAAILPTLIASLPVVIDFLTGLGHGFGVVIAAAKPVFDFLAKHSTTVQAIGAAIGVLATVLGIAAGAFFVLNAVMSANPFVLAVAAIAALAVGIKYAYDNSAKFRSVVDAVGAAIVTAFGNVKAFLTPVFAFLGKVFKGIGSAIGTQIAPIIAFVSAIVDNFGTIKSVVSTVIGFVVDHFKLFAIALGPIPIIFGLVGKLIVSNMGLIGRVIGTVIGFVVDHFGLFAKAVLLIVSPITIIGGLIVQTFGTIKTVIVTVFTGIVTFLTATWNVIKTVFTVALAVLLAPVRLTIAAIVAAFHLLQAIGGIVSAAFSAARAAVGAAFGAVAGVVRGIIGGILAAVRGVSAVAGIMRTGFNAAKTAVGTAVSGIVGKAKDLITKIKGAVKIDLSGAGRALMNTFGAGIKAAADAVYNKVKALANKIKGLLPGSPIKWGPLTSWNNGGAGIRLMNMLGDGIDTGGVKVVTSVENIVGSMQTALDQFKPGDIAAGFAAAASLSGVNTNFSNQIASIIDNTTGPDLVQQIQLNWDTGRGVMQEISSNEAAHAEFVAAAKKRMGVPV